MRALEGKVAIVTGSGRGIGRAVALKLASQGAAVVVNDLDAAPALAVIEEIRGVGGRAIACNGSVTAPDFGERIVQAALDGLGGLDIIVNNAGYTRDGVIHKQSDEQFQAMLDVHVTAPFRILRAAAEPLRAMAKAEAAEGREVIRKVVNISSISGVNGNAGQVNYASAKSAVIGMTRTLAKEWGRLKVCVNCVAFGFIETRLNLPGDHPDARAEIEGRQLRFGVPAGFREAVTAQIPLGRPGTPEEAAGGVYFFCAPESDYVSGQTLLVAGGLGN
ncbi:MULTISPECIES: SDR family NAD(P)-dependent oxidoreductase [unclassified Sphingomonas]|jgi:3-oxoacyl-[acyl-carrier protein] reductase|nr:MULTISPECIES: SDR family NAD(P)-dependent oxidoreductase [unclassified Sphingomonas]